MTTGGRHCKHRDGSVSQSTHQSISMSELSHKLIEVGTPEPICTSTPIVLYSYSVVLVKTGSRTPSVILHLFILFFSPDYRSSIVCRASQSDPWTCVSRYIMYSVVISIERVMLVCPQVSPSDHLTFAKGCVCIVQMEAVHNYLTNPPRSETINRQTNRSPCSFFV